MSIILDGDNRGWLAKERMSVTPKHRLNALTNLLRVLEAIPPNAFDLAVVLTVRGNEKKWAGVAEKYRKVPIGECGAKGCAFGWAGADDWFRRRGIRSDFVRLKDDRGSYLAPTNSMKIKGNDASPWAWFGITHDESIDLFYAEDHDTYRDTKRKVRLLIKKYSKEQPA